METWQAENWRSLISELDRVQQRLVEFVARAGQEPITGKSTVVRSVTELQPMHPPMALERLCEVFGLSEFERSVLLLGVGMEIVAGAFARLCGQAQGEGQPFPTFDLAMGLFPEEAHWSALMPERPLRRWQLIQVEMGTTLVMSRLRVDEWVLHYLLGQSGLDERLVRLVQPVEATDPLVESHQEIAARVAQVWQQEGSNAPMADRRSKTLVQLWGPDETGMRSIAVEAAAIVGWRLYELSVQAIPTQMTEFQVLLMVWQRQVKVQPAVLLLAIDRANEGDGARQAAITQWLAAVRCPVVILGRERRSQLPQAVTIAVELPTRAEQLQVWRQGVGAEWEPVWLERLVDQFQLSGSMIRSVMRSVGAEERGRFSVGEASSPHLSPMEQAAGFGRLWEGCRGQARPRLEDLAQGIQARASWEDLVLPEREIQVLRSVAAQVRQRSQVYERWGFAGQGQRGLGISALFAGPSGTGKTMSAEVLARELELDLYRIDLSAVVSKYIGETEKNLRQVFDAAEAGATILLFDEADALFGKRSEVKDSHDRYANMEVSYLLQRMEAYRGLAILTTNMKEAIDSAFLRRIRFVVKFPFPDVELREKIWRRVFPVGMPLGDVDVGRLARLNVAGGNIRNIAVGAAFLAADAGTVVGMEHVRVAVLSEYAKLERSLTSAEERIWL